VAQIYAPALWSGRMSETDLVQLRKRRGYWLRLARRRANITLATAAELMGYSRNSPSSVKDWEDGIRPPDADQLHQLADLYGVPVSLLTEPSETDEERLDAIVRDASDEERRDWDAGPDGGPSDGGGPGGAPGRPS
jgi:transcriptional regulator with XRE-family HTH domain